MRNTITIIAILVATAFLTSCSTGSGNGSSGKNTIVLVDISKSIKPEVLDWYIQTIEKDICANLSQFDKIKILPIDGASQTASKALLDIDLFEHKAEWDVMGLNANETDKLKKEAFAKFIHSKMEELKAAIAEAKIHRQDVGNATDILGALEVAQGKFDADFNNSIVIMSDMEQYADNCKMCAKGKASNWLSQTADVKYSNIRNFSISVITGEQMAMPKPYYNEIKNYWNEFFTNQGVKSISYQGADASQLKQTYVANN
jgi:type II secretory pathway component GspD/PulD (secretin)